MQDARPDGAERVYVFHGTDSTQVLGPEHLISRVRSLLAAAGTAAAPEPPLHPDIAARPFTSESLQDAREHGPCSWSRGRSTVADVSVEVGAQRFWDRIDAGSWSTWSDRWPDSPDGPLFPPRPPDWLTTAPRWELDPLAPALGPAASGGWVRSPTHAWGEPAPTAAPGASPAPEGPGAPEPAEHHGVGLFQLTDVESFWVFASEAHTQKIVTRCESLSAEHPAFTWLTGYFDARDVAGSLRLPLECLPILQADLVATGHTVDTWW